MHRCTCEHMVHLWLIEHMGIMAYVEVYVCVGLDVRMSGKWACGAGVGIWCVCKHTCMISCVYTCVYACPYVPTYMNVVYVCLHT